MGETLLGGSLQTTSIQQDSHELRELVAPWAEEDQLPVLYSPPRCRCRPILRPPMESRASAAMRKPYRWLAGPSPKSHSFLEFRISISTNLEQKLEYAQVNKEAGIELSQQASRSNAAFTGNLHEIF